MKELITHTITHTHKHSTKWKGGDERECESKQEGTTKNESAKRNKVLKCLGFYLKLKQFLINVSFSLSFYSLSFCSFSLSSSSIQFVVVCLKSVGVCV
jgi:hypothetical protein